jgi:hypothetical protein
MANFAVHVGGAALAGAVFASICSTAGLVAPQHLPLLTLLVTAGGILPDIDLNHARPTQIMFTSLGLIVAFLLVFNKAQVYSLVELWLLAGFAYASVRYLAWDLFNRFTVHRGIFHSLVAALFFCFVTVTMSYTVFDSSRELAWLAGISVTFGYIVHLLLDEAYSVDFLGKRLKNSFGTAFKPIDYKNLYTTTLMSAAAILAFLMTPDASPFFNQLFSAVTWRTFSNNFWPEGMWFMF